MDMKDSTCAGDARSFLF